MYYLTTNQSIFAALLRHSYSGMLFPHAVPENQTDIICALKRHQTLCRPVANNTDSCLWLVGTTTALWFLLFFFFNFSFPLLQAGHTGCIEKRVIGIRCERCNLFTWTLGLTLTWKGELSCGVLPELLWAYHLLDYTFLTQTVKMIDARRCHSLCSLSVRISTDWQR